MRNILIATFIAVSALSMAHAAQPVCGSATVSLPDNLTTREGKEEAINQARLAGIAAAHGTALADTGVRPQRLHSADVNGSWTGDAGPQDISVDMTPDGVVTIHCDLRGNTIPHPAVRGVEIDITITAPAGAPEAKVAAVTVKSSRKGNLALYLVDDSAGTAVRLKPEVKSDAVNAGVGTSADGNTALPDGVPVQVSIAAPEAGRWLYAIVSERPLTTLSEAMSAASFDTELTRLRAAGRAALRVFPY